MESGKKGKRMKKTGIDKLLKAHADIGAITPGETETPEEANEVVDLLKELRRMIRKYEEYEGMVAGKPHDYDLKAENKELKKQIEIRTQELVVYRSLAMLIGSIKSCERFIDKGKALDEIIKHFENNFNSNGTVK